MPHRFYRDGTGCFENVQPELWQWEAHYNDGTFLCQFGADGVFHQFREIDQSCLHAFRMVSIEREHSYTLLFDPASMKLIYFYRHVWLNHATPEELRFKLYCFGYELRTRPKVRQLFVITPSGEMIVTDDIDQLRIE